MLIRKIIYKLNRVILFVNFYYHDFLDQYKYSLGGQNKTRDAQEALIMLTMHAIEKGLSFSVKKNEWGREKSKLLCSMIEKHISSYGNTEVTNIAINILAKYREDKYATQDKEITNGIDTLLESNKFVLNPNIGGIKQVIEPPTFDKEKIKEFFASRSSVREFSNVPVTDEEIFSALQVANYTPTACNRQTSRVHVIRDRNTINMLLDNQLGDQGWCKNANIVFVITSNVSYFNGMYERHQGFIDGGLYAMNFVWGLHLQHIATCFKMFVNESKRQRDFQKICKIPRNETPVVLVLAGHYKDERITSPKSERLQIRYY